MKLRAARARIAPAGLMAVAVALTSAAVGLVAVPAGAAPSTKYYLSTATPSSFDVSPSAPTAPNVTFTLTNCGSNTPGCAKASTQSWGSAHVTLPAGWSWGFSTLHPLVVTVSNSAKSSHWGISDVVTDTAGNTVVELGNDGTSSTYAIAPGEKLTFSAWLTPSPPGLAAVTTEVKQSNDFSGTGNDFLHASGTTDPTIVIGAPDHLEFVTAPQTVQVSTATKSYYMCDNSNLAPSVQVVDKTGHTVTWVQGLPITLNSTGSPGLSYLPAGASKVANSLTESTVNGVATFGAACTSGLAATNLGGGYLMGASALFGSLPLTVPTPLPFDVLQFFQPCVGSCDTKTLTSGDGHTGVDVQANGSTTNRLAASLGVFSHVNSQADCAGDDGNPNRAIVSVDIANHSKNVLLSWDKTAVQWSVNNGTPFWDVCMWAANTFPTAGGGSATLSTDSAFYVGVLPACSDPNVTDLSVDPCITSLYRRAGVEYAAVTLPLNMPGDPQFK